MFRHDKVITSFELDARDKILSNLKFVTEFSNRCFSSAL